MNLNAEDNDGIKCEGSDTRRTSRTMKRARKERVEKKELQENVVVVEADDRTEGDGKN